MPFQPGTSAGEYIMSYDGLSVGPCSSGKDISATILGEEISESDRFGLTLTDNINRGKSLTISFEVQTWDSATLRLLILNSSVFSDLLIAPLPGTSAWDEAKQTVLTVRPGTLAQQTGPNSITFPRTRIELGNSNNINLNSVLRRTQILLRVYPVEQLANGRLRFGVAS